MGDITLQVCDYESVGISFLWYGVLKMDVISNIVFDLE